MVSYVLWKNVLCLAVTFIQLFFHNVLEAVRRNHGKEFIQMEWKFYITENSLHWKNKDLENYHTSCNHSHLQQPFTHTTDPSSNPCKCSCCTFVLKMTVDNCLLWDNFETLLVNSELSLPTCAQDLYLQKYYVDWCNNMVRQHTMRHEEWEWDGSSPDGVALSFGPPRPDRQWCFRLLMIFFKIQHLTSNRKIQG